MLNLTWFMIELILGFNQKGKSGINSYVYATTCEMGLINGSPEKGSIEEDLYNNYLTPRDWLSENAK